MPWKNLYAFLGKTLCAEASVAMVRDEKNGVKACVGNVAIEHVYLRMSHEVCDLCLGDVDFSTIKIVQAYDLPFWRGSFAHTSRERKYERGRD